MSNTERALKSLIDQWSSIFVARYCLTCDLSPETLQSRLLKLASQSPLKDPLRQGLELSRETPPQNLIMIFQSLSSLLSEFSSNLLFPSMFTSLMTATHAILTLPLVPSTQTKPKAMHTDSLTTPENLTPAEILSCETLHFLSSILASASLIPSVSLERIDPSIVSLIFTFLSHDQPTSVRVSAGEIISALSLSQKHCSSICDHFWRQFGNCKKDDEFRNFASWIDGITNIRLTQIDLTNNFLNLFVQYSKRIERGVLRTKFLVALLEIIKKQNGRENSEYRRLVGEVFQVAVKWSSKGKHALVCFDFLVNLINLNGIDFFVERGKLLLDLICKAAKSGDPEFLSLLVVFVKKVPTEYSRKRAEDFEQLVNQSLFPTILTNKKLVKFNTPSQIEIMRQILTEVGCHQLHLIVDVFRTVFSFEKVNDDVKRTRLLMLQVLSDLCSLTPQLVSSFNTQLFPLIEPILLQNVTFPEENEYAIKTFPLIHSQNETKLALTSQILFDSALNNSEVAFKSLKAFIERLVTLTSNALTPLNYLNKLIESILSVPSEEQMRRLEYIEELSKALGNSLSKQTGTLGAIKTGNSPLTVNDWLSFRYNLDALLIILCVLPDMSQKARTISKVYEDEIFNEVDQICLNCSPFISNWLPKLGEREDPLNHVNTLVSLNLERSQALFNSTFEAFKNKKVPQKVLLMATALCRAKNSKLFEELDNSSLAYLDVSLWTDLLDSMSLVNTNGWTRSVTFHYTLSQRSEFGQLVRSDAQLRDVCERFATAFLKQPNEETEKGFTFIITLVRANPDSASTIISDITQFLNTCVKLLSERKSNTLPEIMLQTMTSVLTIVKWGEEAKLGQLGNFLQNEVNSKSDERFTSLFTSLMTAILNRNEALLEDFFACSLDYHEKPAASLILAIGNAAHNLVAQSDMLLAVALVHVKSPHLLIRLSANRLICILVELGETLFNPDVPSPLSIALPSSSLSGFLSQADHFVTFASAACLNPLGVLQAYSNQSSHDKNASLTLSSLCHFLFTQSTESTQSMLRITKNVNLSDLQIGLSLESLWNSYLSRCSPSVCDDLFENLSPSLQGILPLTYASRHFPDLVFSTLIKNLSSFDISLPSEISLLPSFLNTTKLSLDVTPVQTGSMLALSETSLSLSSQLLINNLIPLILFSAFHGHIELETKVPPLLDSLLDCSLVRNNSAGSLHLTELKKAGFFSQNSGANRMLCYDEEAIKLIAELIPGGKSALFEKVLACALCSNSPEPFVMLMSLREYATPGSINALLLYSLHSLRNRKEDCLDAVVDNIRSLSNSESEVIASLASMVGLCQRRQLITHVMRVLSEVKSSDVVRDEVNGFLELFGGEGHLFATFATFVRSSTSAGERETAAECLQVLDKLLNPVPGRLGLLSELIRYFEKPTAELAQSIVSRYEQFSGEIVSYIGEGFREGLFTEGSMVILKELVRIGGDLSQDDGERLMRLAYLVGMTSSEIEKEGSADVIEKMIERGFGRGFMQVQPRFVESQKGPRVDVSLMPVFEGGSKAADNSVVLREMWRFVSEKSGLAFISSNVSFVNEPVLQELNESPIAVSEFDFKEEEEIEEEVGEDLFENFDQAMDEGEEDHNEEEAVSEVKEEEVVSEAKEEEELKEVVSEVKGKEEEDDESGNIFTTDSGDDQELSDTNGSDDSD